MMMPIAPTALVAMPANKPKIGFSIDSIVGSAKEKSVSPTQSEADLSSQSMATSFDSSPCSPISIDNDIYRHRSRSRSPRRQSTSPMSATLDPGSFSPPPGVVRPSVLPPGSMPPFPKGLCFGDPLVSTAGSQHQLALAAAAAQHFSRLGANIVSALTPPFDSSTTNGHLQPPAVHSLHSSHQPHGAPLRESYPLYPWLLSRHHGRIYPHRFPGGKYEFFMYKLLGEGTYEMREIVLILVVCKIVLHSL